MAPKYTTKNGPPVEAPAAEPVAPTVEAPESFKGSIFLEPNPAPEFKLEPPPAVDTASADQVTALKNKLWAAERDTKAAKDEAESAKVRLKTISEDKDTQLVAAKDALAKTEKALEEATAKLKATSGKLATLEAKERPTANGNIKQIETLPGGELVVLFDNSALYKVPAGSTTAIPFTLSYKG